MSEVWDRQGWELAVDMLMKERRIILLAVTVFACALSGHVWGQPAPDYDFNWAMIGVPGNPAYQGPIPGGPLVQNRGGVDYVFRIARTEVTTAQWLEFVNAFTTSSDPAFGLGLLPGVWGAQRDLDYNGPGYRWMLRKDTSDAAMLPVAYISWREVALFCNWLNNGKPFDPKMLRTGAYDTSTWGDKFPVFTDESTHLASAQFWIPTLDEWIKAVYYDPNRYGEGKGGYWQYANSSDNLPVSGSPGVGTTSAGYDTNMPFGEWDIPLGAYLDALSPWGLWDTSGASQEWTEEVITPEFRRARALKGSYAGPAGSIESDHVSRYSAMYPESALASGLRVVSAVPSISSGALIVMVIVTTNFRRRRK